MKRLQQWVQRAVLSFAIILVSCGGGGSAAPRAVDDTGPGRLRVGLALPAYTDYSTDLVDPFEGTVSAPLRLAEKPRCVFLPVWEPQYEVCSEFTPPAWQQSNYRATAQGFFKWRVAVNVERAWDTRCNSGPPNQSLSLDSPNVIWQPGNNELVIGFDLANETDLCSKAPYVSVSYVRGVQEDPVPRLAPWGSHQHLSFFSRVERTQNAKFAQQLYFWVHLRDTVTGKRYMAHTLLWSNFAAEPWSLAWNWPIVGSFQYPGAYMQGGPPGACAAYINATDMLGATRWQIDLEGLTACRFPGLAALAPDILGFEIAAEGTYLDFAHPTGERNRMRAVLTDFAVTP